MIKNVVFDMGNVLVDFDPIRFVQEKTQDENQQKLLLLEVFGSVDWLRFDKGTMDREELLSSVKKRLPKELHAVAEDLLATWYHGLRALPQIEKLPQRLKDNGLGIYILSNAPKDFYLYEEKVPSRKAFDGVFISADWRLAKPEHEIFRTFYSHFRLNPAECYFIDDSAANILAAEETGMRGFHYRKDYPRLEEELIQLGLL